MQRARHSRCRGRRGQGPEGPHAAPTWMSPGLADPGLRHPLYTQGASSPVLHRASFSSNPLSFQKWHEAIRSPGRHLSFVGSPLCPFPSGGGGPSGGDTSDVVKGVGSLRSHLLWKEVWLDRMPLWKLKLNCLHFLSFYFSIPVVPASQGLHRQFSHSSI